YLAGRQIGVDSLGRAARERAAHGDHVLRPDVLGLLVRGGVDFGIKDDLHDSAAIPQVDEDEAAVIAPALHPADKDQLAADGVGARLSAVNGALPSTQVIGKYAVHFVIEV